LELTVTAVIIGVVAVIVAQCVALSLRERARAAAHHAATEIAANMLEDARSLPFAKLDKSWADRQLIPTEMAEWLPEGKVAVVVEPHKSLPHARHVHVEVTWRFEQHLPLQSVRLTTLLSDRQAKKTGGTP